MDVDVDTVSPKTIAGGGSTKFVSVHTSVVTVGVEVKVLPVGP